MARGWSGWRGMAWDGVGWRGMAWGGVGWRGMARMEQEAGHMEQMESVQIELPTSSSGLHPVARATRTTNSVRAAADSASSADSGRGGHRGWERR
eukprot:CAMPEP_0181250824 /NCGR_PEP_ID=MMETSP1096-20121128/46527_1 /TAXON_ID=156174 ORGANISM="Chrysochromulina ericina, Strain CCMP281" /NCGR_SAMPLE_ID=MMETSP1096 /ASSEMBLY_ACC=CAM_ASM_000453 /LENGTH=94 /DNA_ID=CAMNT_0023348321 /DNA_START=631 /DNA_END=915 /DNA_ORIENTATION=+